MKKGFSLAEMMIVLLIVSIALAASAPMITRKVSRERSNKIFDVLDQDQANAVEYVKGRNQIIFMNARKNGYVGITETNTKIPTNSVLFGYNNFDKTLPPTHLVGIGFGTENHQNSVAIGYNAIAKKDSIAIGYSAQWWNLDDTSNGSKAVIIGNTAGAGTNSVAIGYNASAKPNSVAIGYGAKALKQNSTSVGYKANTTYENSVAIGYGAKAPYAKTIVLGTEDDTVYIPGNLVVDHAALIGRAGTRNDNLYFLPYAQEDGRHFSVLSAGDYQGDDSNIAIVRNKNRSNKPIVEVGPFTTTTSDKWHGGYNDNSFVKIDFDTPENGDFVCASKHAGRDCNSGGSGIGAEHRGVLSDMRLKDIGEAFTGGLAELDKLNIYHFTFKNDEKKTPHVGVMAQNLQEVFPNAVTENNEGYLQIRWDEMLYSVINAIKELNSKVVAISEKLQQIPLDITNLKTLTETQQATIDEQTKIIQMQQDELDKLTEKVEKLEHKKK